VPVTAPAAILAVTPPVDALSVTPAPPVILVTPVLLTVTPPVEADTPTPVPAVTLVTPVLVNVVEPPNATAPPPPRPVPAVTVTEEFVSLSLDKVPLVTFKLLTAAIPRNPLVTWPDCKLAGADCKTPEAKWFDPICPEAIFPLLIAPADNSFDVMLPDETDPEPTTPDAKLPAKYPLEFIEAIIFPDSVCHSCAFIADVFTTSLVVRTNPLLILIISSTLVVYDKIVSDAVPDRPFNPRVMAVAPDAIPTN
jgi:hypothetical protein